jgi:hypothetical protein
MTYHVWGSTVTIVSCGLIASVVSDVGQKEDSWVVVGDYIGDSAAELNNCNFQLLNE